MSAITKFPEPSDAHKNLVRLKFDDSTLLNWAISLFLIAIVSFFFTFSGTGGPITSLLGGIAAVSCLLLALVIFLVYIWHRHRRTELD
jgi:membrane protein implicated in regulation of membrane protease activity